MILFQFLIRNPGVGSTHYRSRRHQADPFPHCPDDVPQIRNIPREFVLLPPYRTHCDLAGGAAQLPPHTISVVARMPLACTTIENASSPESSCSGYNLDLKAILSAMQSRDLVFVWHADNPTALRRCRLRHRSSIRSRD